MLFFQSAGPALYVKDNDDNIFNYDDADNYDDDEYYDGDDNDVDASVTFESGLLWLFKL